MHSSGWEDAEEVGIDCYLLSGFVFTPLVGQLKVFLIAKERDAHAIPECGLYLLHRFERIVCRSVSGLNTTNQFSDEWLASGLSARNG